MIKSTSSYIASDAYPYECSCGERYSTVDAAYHCRKCRNYCVFGYCTHVVDIRDGSVVRGFEPSEERYAAAEASYVKRIEAEQAEYKAYVEMETQTGEAWEAHIAMTRRQAEEENEDALYQIQDEMNGLRS